MAISGTYSDGDAINFNDCEVEVDLTPSSSSFANIDSWAASIEVDPKTVQTTESYTFTHTGPIVFTGNPDPRNVTVTCVYTEGATDPFKNINDHTIGADFDVRFAPKGGATGDYQFTTSGGKLISVGSPQGAADGSTATTFTFVVRCSSISQGTIA